MFAGGIAAGFWKLLESCPAVLGFAGEGADVDDAAG
jgi:hypothetical protein